MKSRRRKRTSTAALKIPGFGRGSAVAVREFQPILAEILEEIEDDLRAWNDHHDSHPVGAKDTLAARAAAISGMETEALLRRIYDVMRFRTNSLKAEIAEALIEAVDSDAKVTEVPIGFPAAVERIEIAAEIQGVTLSRETVEDLAEDLLAFSHLMVWGADSPRWDAMAREKVAA